MLICTCFKVTYFKCGGMCLGIAMHHWTVDGSSAMYFANSWAEMARGHAIDEPIHDRRSITNLALTCPKFSHPEFDANALLGHSKPRDQTRVDVDVSTVCLRISRDQADVLKDRANADASGRSYSVYESLAAHMWHCACRARGLRDDQKTSLIFPVNARPRLSPPIPRELFGNVINMSAPSALSGEILKETLSATVGRVREAITEKENEYIRSGIAYLRDKQVMNGFSGMSAFRNPNLGVTSWSQMPIHAMDFGWGSPVYVAPASIRSEGKTYVLCAGPSKDDGLALFICLETLHLELFKKLFNDF